MKKMKKIVLKNNLKGFTLIEILVITGVVTIATIGTYGIFKQAVSWSNANEEATQLNNAISRLNRATNASGLYTGMNKDVLDSLGGSFNSNFNLTGINSPTPDKLHINYAQMSSLNCTKFVSKMLATVGSVSAIVNGKNTAGGEQIVNISDSCSNDENAVTIVLTNSVSVAGLTPIVPTLPPPPPPPPAPPPAPVPVPVPAPVPVPPPPAPVPVPVPAPVPAPPPPAPVPPPPAPVPAPVPVFIPAPVPVPPPPPPVPAPVPVPPPPVPAPAPTGFEIYHSASLLGCWRGNGLPEYGYSAPIGYAESWIYYDPSGSIAASSGATLVTELFSINGLSYTRGGYGGLFTYLVPGSTSDDFISVGNYIPAGYGGCGTPMVIEI